MEDWERNNIKFETNDALAEKPWHELWEQRNHSWFCRCSPGGPWQLMLNCMNCSSYIFLGYSWYRRFNWNSKLVGGIIKFQLRFTPKQVALPSECFFKYSSCPHAFNMCINTYQLCTIRGAISNKIYRNAIIPNSENKRTAHNLYRYSVTIISYFLNVSCTEWLHLKKHFLRKKSIKSNFKVKILTKNILARWLQLTSTVMSPFDSM